MTRATHYFLPVLGLLLTLLPASAAAQGTMEPLPKLRAGTPPYSVLGNIMGANNLALQGIKPEAPGIEEEEAPHLVWLADADARIRPGLVWNRQTGGIFTVRNLANQLEPAAAAVDYGIRQLYAPILLITGNSDSQAIALFNSGYDQLGEAIRRELNQLHPAIAHLGASGKEARSSEATATLRLRQAEGNVDYQVNLALERYRDRVESGRLVIAGGIIDLANQYGGGPGRLHLINLNGETEPAKIQASSHLIRTTPEMRKFIGRK